MNDAANRAGAQALAALHEAERRHAEKQKRRRKKPTDPPKAKPPRVSVRCVYCGEFTRSRKSPATCALHRDLPALDPHFRA